MQKLTPRAARAYVIGVAAKVLRMSPQHARRRGGGLTNLVYQVDVDDRSVIVRVNVDPDKLKVFRRERLAMTLARNARLPVPRVLRVRADTHPFMILDATNPRAQVASKPGSASRRHASENVIVAPQGEVIAVLDWEHCTSSVPALWDLSVALHDLTIDEKQVFLQGYGYGPRELTKSIGYMRLLNALNYTPLIVAAAERGETAKLNWYRARFAGNFNLYQ